MCYHLFGKNCFPKHVNLILRGYFSVGFYECLLVMLVHEVFITSFVIVQFLRYNISTRQFSKNGLVVKSNYDCFYLFCCYFDMLFVYSNLTGMHHSYCTKIGVWFVVNKAHHSPRDKESRWTVLKM